MPASQNLVEAARGAPDRRARPSRSCNPPQRARYLLSSARLSAITIRGDDDEQHRAINEGRVPRVSDEPAVAHEQPLAR